jgi:uncharacterized protein (AIM24 family)
VSASGWQEQPPIKDMARIQFGQSSCQIEGTYVPSADFKLAGPAGAAESPAGAVESPAGAGDSPAGAGQSADWIYFSHHHVLWIEPTVQLQAMPMEAGWNRVRAGLPLVMLAASGPGHIALSDDAPGEVVAIPLQAGQGMWVREHRFLAATGNVAYSWQQSGIWIVTGSGDDRETHYPLGMYLDLFQARDAPGLLLLHSPGNTFIRDLAAGETICIQPSSLLYKDPSVGMQLHIEYPRAAGLTFSGRYSYRQVWLRLWGPGRVAVQSVFERPEASNQISSHSPATTTAW